jgi:hypothetical protein
MLRYVLRRVVWGAVMLVVVSRADVRHLHHPPLGRPGRAPCRPAGDTGADRPDPAEPRARPAVYVQYWRFLEGLVVHFDLGYSYQNSVSVKSQVFTRLP